MDPITQQTTIAAAGAGGGDPVYVDDVFSTYLWDGTGTAQTINNGLDLAGEGGLVWAKSRTGTEHHCLFDSERGKTGSYFDMLISNGNYDQQTAYSFGLTSLNNNGFSLGGNDNQFNGSSSSYVSWSFRKAPGFFDVVTWTGSGANNTNRRISHSLGSVPGMILIKKTDAAKDWYVYHRSAPAQFGTLNSTNAFSSTSHNYWGTGTTSTDFGINESNLGISDGNYVAYVFAHDDASFGTDGDESIIKCGSYTGNSSTAGPEINLGWEPQWVMIKRTDASSINYNWIIYDSMRGVVTGTLDTNGNDKALSANLSDPEDTGKNYADDLINFTSTGFKLNIQGYSVTDSGNHIYMAIRRPHKPPEVGTEVFAMDYGSTSSTIPTFDSGFPVDFGITKPPTGTDDFSFLTRLTGTGRLIPAETNAENTNTALPFDSNEGWGKTYGPNTLSWMFKRAPGFMDVVAYTGDGTASHAVPHNLGVAPELLIVKHRTGGTRDWHVYTQPTGATSDMRLNNSNAASTGFTYWANTTPTATHFYVSNVPAGDIVNQNNNPFIAYLFATLPGISKVGSYTGTGNPLNVDCGFTNGARFVLIKRTSGTGNWYLWDTVRGIVNGNDPFLYLNTTNAQITYADYLDPLNAGFIVNPGDTSLNASGESYIFLAIA